MTNFKCVFCSESMEIPRSLRGKVNPVTFAFWHDDCVDNPKYKLTDEQRKFYHKTGNEF